MNRLVSVGPAPMSRSWASIARRLRAAFHPGFVDGVIISLAFTMLSIPALTTFAVVGAPVSLLHLPGFWRVALAQTVLVLIGCGLLAWVTVRNKRRFDREL